MPDTCPKCLTLLDADAIFCPSCAASVNPKCPSCQKPIASDAKFCKYCAFDLSQTAPTKSAETSGPVPTKQPASPRQQSTSGIDGLLADKYRAMSDSQLLAMLRGDLSGQTEKSLSIALVELETRANVDWRDMGVAKTRVKEAIVAAHSYKSVGSYTSTPQNIDGKSSIGLKPNIAAALSYALIWIIGCVSGFIIGFKIVQDYGPSIATTNDRLLIQIQMTMIMYLIISGVITLGAGCIFFVMEKESRVVRLHSMQAILFGVLWFAASILLSVMGMALGAGVTLLSIPVSIAFLVVWILLMVKAYKGDMLKLPIICNMAENIVSK